jgi:molecular chaperone DnaJ
MKDYYKILELDKNASIDDIKKSYRKLAMMYHPDRNQSPDAENKFKDIAEAYDVLSNPEKKNNYDNYGSTDSNGSFSFNFGDFFNFGDMFNQAFDRQYKRQKKGTDLRIKISISIEDVIHGLSKKIKYKRKTVCNSCKGIGGSGEQNCMGCNGSGTKYKVQNTPFGQIRQEMTCNICMGKGKIIANKCKSCTGEGLVIKDEEIDITIPAGLRNGMQLSMSKQGNEIPDGIPGDLFILVEEKQDSLFKREGRNLYYTYNINILDLLLGKKDSLKTPHGSNIDINIEKLTNPNEVKIFKNKGVPDIEEGLGDLFLKLDVKMPSNLTNEEFKILNSLKEKQNFKS